MTTTPPEADQVLALWFGELDADGFADAQHTQRWWKKDPAFDQQLRDRFLALHAAVRAGQRDAWLATPRGRLATVIVLDQLSRNMFRDRSEAFASDGQALRVALETIGLGADRGLAAPERAFLYMPLVHTEDLATQDRAVELFRGLVDSLPAPTAERMRVYGEFAVRHRDIVARFGRFPHRNEVLGRPSTPAELEFLQQPGSSF